MSDETPNGSGTTKTRDDSRESYDPEELIGTTLAGRYEVEKCIGKGGMGVVYLASQSALDRKVVVKVLPSSFVDDEEAIARFEREAVGMSKLQHPNIVSIYDFGHEEEHAYICMEYVDGHTLSREIKRGGAVSVERFGPIASQILQGLGEAHSMGMIHRDIKPSNIMLTERHGRADYVKILDFGLAKLVKGARDVTKEQSLVGSVSFLSPEQIMGNDIDQRVDVYALGVLFYFMLAGEKPFDADDDITILYQHVHNEPTDLREVLPQGHRLPDGIADLIMRMLAKAPQDRPKNAGTILEELTNVFATTSLQIPWSTGEFASVGNPSSSPEELSGRLDRPRQHTPMHQRGPDTSPSREGLPHPDSGTASRPSGATWVTGEQVLQMQKESSRRSVVLTVLVALLVVGIGLGAYLLYMRDTGPTAADVRQEIARATTLIEKGKLGQADSTLALIKDDLKTHPSLKADYAAVQDKLAIAELMSDARFYEEQDQPQKAIAAYKEVLNRNATHAQAQEALQTLSEQVRDEAAQGAETGKLKVTSEPAAMVYLDGLPLGETPVTETITAGEHDIKVEKEGYEPWSRTVEIQPDATLPLGLVLQPTEDAEEPAERAKSGAPKRKSRQPERPERAKETPERTQASRKGPAKPVEDKKPAQNDGVGLLPVDDGPSEPADDDDDGDDEGLLLPVE